MKKIILLFVFLVFYAPNALFAKADKLSNIPPASLEFINLEPQECNIACLFELLKKGECLVLFLVLGKIFQIPSC